MPISKLTTAVLANLVSKQTGPTLSAETCRLVLDAMDDVIDRALQAGYEVEIGSLGYLSLKDPKQTTPPRGTVNRGKRVTFREKDSNRHRWK